MVSSLNLCVSELRLISVTGGLARFGALGTQASVSTSSVPLVNADVPSDDYAGVEVDLSAGCAAVSSVSWSNTSGSFKTHDPVTLHFPTRFTVGSATQKLTLGMQAFMDQLASVTAASQAKPALESVGSDVGVTSGGGINIEVPIELLDYGLASKVAPVLFARSRTTLSTVDYDGTVNYMLEVVATNADSFTRNVSLVNASGATIATIPVSGSLAAPTRLRVPFAPSTGADDYRLRLDGTAQANQLQIYAGRILVQQTGATQTRIYVPLTGAYAGVASNADTSAASVDNAIFGGVYGQNNPHFFSLWRRNDSAFSQIAAGTPFTLEAVLGTSTAGSTTASVSLFDATSNTQVVASEVSTTSSAPSLVSASFAAGAAGFTNLDSMEVRIKNSGGSSNAWIYKAGLWIRLTNLAHAEVVYRYSKTDGDGGPAGQYQTGYDVTLLDLSRFSSATVYHEATGSISSSGTPCAEQLFDIGPLGSGPSGTSITASLLSFNTLTNSRQRTTALPLISGDQFISETLANMTSNICYISQPTIVVAF
jgi:hypothetical protein